MVRVYPRSFSPDEIREIARRIESIARKGKNVRLLPQTGLVSASALRMYAARPLRPEIVDVICGFPKSCAAYPCIRCIGQANSILHLVQGEER